MRHNPSRRRAFSLLELLVVLGIAALMASVVMGGFSSYQGSQRRATCQSNMVQIYRAVRLYANDNDAFPHTYQVAGQTQLSGGLGLLWAQPDEVPDATQQSGRSFQNSGLKAPGELTSYLKTPNALHCPTDVGNDPVTNQPYPRTAVNAQNQVNLGFLSYQKPDPLGGDQGYLPARTPATGDPDYSRQLRHLATNGTITTIVDIPTPSSTIITWCPFHRGASSKPDTVLFFDGSVRRLEVTQNGSCSPAPGRSGSLAGWRRVAQCSTDVTGTAPDNEGARLAQP